MLGGGQAVCQNPEGHYFIRKNDSEQGLLEKGEHEVEGNEILTACELVSKTFGSKIKATVSGCAFHLISTKEQLKGLTGAFEKECLIKAENCEIKVPSTGNKELVKAADAANSESNDVVNIHATGITASASGLICELFSVKSSKEGKLEEEVTNRGQNVH